MKRLNSIDSLRGLSMLWMFIGHLSGWWMVMEDMYVAHLLFAIFDPIGASAFIFVSGISTVFSVRNRYRKSITDGFYTYKIIRKEYFVRALLIFGLALGYNLFLVFFFSDIYYIWTWFVLLTIAISLNIGWCFLNSKKIVRIIIIIFVWVLNQFLIILLLPHQGEKNLLGFFFYLLYNSLDLDFILGFFPFFLLGTIIGDVIHEIYRVDNQNDRKRILKKKLIYPSILIGIILILFGISFQLRLGNIYGHGTELFNFPDFLISRSFSWFWYVAGILLIFTSLLLVLEESIHFKIERENKFLYYYSYYSLTIFLTHNLLFFLFPNMFNASVIWFPILITIIVVWLLLRIIYHSRWRDYFSLKIQIGRLTSWLIRKSIDHGLN